MKNIAVSKEAWKTIRDIKTAKNLTHFGDVINLLLKEQLLVDTTIDTMESKMDKLLISISELKEMQQELIK